MDVGYYGILFNKLTGNISPQIYKEGINFKIPFLQDSIIYNIQTREQEITDTTANRDMQSVRLTVRMLFHPEVSKLN